MSDSRTRTADMFGDIHARMLEIQRERSTARRVLVREVGYISYDIACFYKNGSWWHRALTYRGECALARILPLYYVVKGEPPNNVKGTLYKADFPYHTMAVPNIDHGSHVLVLPAVPHDLADQQFP